ncbi:hypothetical protein EC919_104398 [Pseudomonas graminis]|uniref:hypothetical protein n=1 Tax=Pseudomonas graminis TaxID=158627 RepID=UPI00105E6FF3|nr:hypothetical protein [Pseudomonas graminis]TDV54659.1 hypothetical protein EC919_104398 [Pseudomonas graminis]
MAVDFFTSNPQNLLNQFKSKINQTELTGKITTWDVDSDGDFTHKSGNWGRQAWFRPSVKQGVLTFNIIKPQNQAISTPTYGYYHGHLTETFLNHFDNLFTQASSTALPTGADMVS